MRLCRRNLTALRPSPSFRRTAARRRSNRPVASRRTRTRAAAHQPRRRPPRDAGAADRRAARRGRHRRRSGGPGRRVPPATEWPRLRHPRGRPGAVGSWPAYYDSLTLFSPARSSALPGLPFPGRSGPLPGPRRGRCLPARLRRSLRAADRAPRPRRPGRPGRRPVHADHRRRADLLGAQRDRGHGRLLHGPPARLARPGQLRGRDPAHARVPLSRAVRRPACRGVGSSNSAVQVAAELAGVAHVTLTSRAPLRFRR